MGKSNRVIPKGRTFSTYDNFLGKNKTNSRKKRPVVAIDSNCFGEFIAVPLSTKNGLNRTHLPKYQNGKSYFKHYIEIFDDEGYPIRPNKKFRENHKNMDVSQKDVDRIRYVVFKKSKQYQRNKKLNDVFSNRYKNSKKK